MTGTAVGGIVVNIGANTSGLTAGINQATTALSAVGTGANTANQNLQQLANRALIDNLRDMSNALGGISGAVISFGKDIAGAAMQAENFRIAMTTAFQGNQEAADKMLDWAKQFANETPFETNEIVEATIKLKDYNFTAEEIPKKLGLIGDMASRMGKSMNQAVEAIADATTGELERLKEFGITKKMLNDEVNGTLINSKNQITDMNLLMESLSSIMEKRFAGGMEAASKSTAGQISNLKGEFSALKEELGAELLPTINNVVKGLTDLTKWVRTLDPEVKSTVLTFTAWAGGIALAGQAVTGISAVAAPFTAVVTSLSASITAASGSTVILGASMGALGAALPVIAIGALIIALGTLAYATIEYNKTVTELQRTDLEGSSKREAEAVTALREAFNGATTPTQAYFQVIKEGVDTLLKSEEGIKRLDALLKSSVTSEMAQTEQLNNLQKEKVSLETQLSNVRSKNKDGDNKVLNEQEKQIKAEIAETNNLIKQKQDYIKEMREERKTIYEAQKAHKENTKTVKENVDAKKEEIPVVKEATKAVKEKIEVEKKGAVEVAEVKEKADKTEEKKSEEKIVKKEADNQKLLSISQALLDGQEQQKAAAAEKENQRIEAQKLKTEQANDAGSFLVDVMKDVASSTGQAKEEAGGMAEELKKSVVEAEKVAKAMQSIGNITAAKGGGTKSGLGEFSSASNALADLPGSKSYSGEGSGFGLGRGGSEGMGNIPSFATPAGSNSASTAISNTSKTNASIAFNFGDTNLTNNMPQSVIDAGKTMTSWATALQMRGARS